MPDADVVDEIVANCQGWGVDPRPFLAMLWWESRGLKRSITWTNDDGTIGRTFPGGDFAVRADGTYGPQSFGVCQIYSVVHGPFLSPGHPDYRAAASKWDNVTTSMQYMSVNGPRSGWLSVYRNFGGDALYRADPHSFMVAFSPAAQGSDPWAAWMADEAVPAAEAAYQDYVSRHAVAPTPTPEPVPDPTPAPTPPVDGPTSAELADRIAAVASAIEAVTAELNIVDQKFETKLAQTVSIDDMANVKEAIRNAAARLGSIA